MNKSSYLKSAVAGLGALTALGTTAALAQEDALHPKAIEFCAAYKDVPLSKSYHESGEYDFMRDIGPRHKLYAKFSNDFFKAFDATEGEPDTIRDMLKMTGESFKLAYEQNKSLKRQTGAEPTYSVYSYIGDRNIDVSYNDLKDKTLDEVEGIKELFDGEFGHLSMGLKFARSSSNYIIEDHGDDIGDNRISFSKGIDSPVEEMFPVVNRYSNNVEFGEPDIRARACYSLGQ